MADPERRLPSVRENCGPFSYEIDFCPIELRKGNLKPIAIFFNDRSKSGSELEEILYNMGVQISKIFQEGP